MAQRNLREDNSPRNRSRRARQECACRVSIRGQWDLVLTGSCEEALEALQKMRAAVILCARDLPGVDWRHALEKLSSSRPDCPIVLTSSVNDEYLWDEVIHKGGYDVLSKPLQEDLTVRAVNLAWSYSKERAREKTAS